MYMDWTQVLVLIGSNFGLFLWVRSESRADSRHMDAKLESTRDLVRAIHEDGRNFREQMASEMKDFHYKLIEIERDRK
jgi:hypothetical protein